MGSVARGDARPRLSDIDFVAIIKELPSKDVQVSLIERARDLSSRHACVSKVDLEIEVLGQVDPSREFIFITDSLSLLGSDIYRQGSVTIDAGLLARQNTPDLGHLLQIYKRGVTDSRTDKELLQYSLWIGKDLLKSFRARMLSDHGIYERTAERISAALTRLYPTESGTFAFLFRLYNEPTPDRDLLLRSLSVAEYTGQRLGLLPIS